MIQTMLLLALLAQHPAAMEPQAVAKLKWEQGNVPTFVRGTVPVPSSETAGGWVLINHEGVSHPAQLEEVVRGPMGEALVYEVIAKLPASEQREQSGTLARVLRPSGAKPLAPAHELLTTSLELSARDANGLLYQAKIETQDPSHQQLLTLKSGPIHREDRHALIMLPSPEATQKGAQPHLFGVHAYLGRWQGANYLTLDLRLHNALIGPEPTEAPIGPLYFEALKLSMPEGWTAIADVDDPYLTMEDGDSSLQLVNGLEHSASGRQRLHMIPPGASFHRRLALFQATDEAAREAARAHLAGDGWAVCAPKDDLYSWSNKETANYFPQRELLPDLSRVQAPLGKRESSLLARLKLADDEHAQQITSGASGQGSFRSGSLGWAHPWFRPSGGGHGGEGITFLEGLRALASGAPVELRRLRLLHRANNSRQPTGAWRANGSATHLEEWLNEDGELPFAYHMKANAHHKALRLPCEGGPIIDEGILIKLSAERRPPYDQSDAIERNGARPTDAADILAWHPHDGAHIVRYTAHAKALAWLSNDSLAIDALLQEAERFRFAIPSAPSKAPPLTSLHQLSAFADEHPAHGLPVGRELGWGLDTVSAAFALGDDETRSRLIPWIREACTLVVKGTPPTGITTRNDHAPLSVTRTHAIAHSFQTAILQLGLRSAQRSCLSDSDRDLTAELEQLFMACVETLYFGQVFDLGPKPQEVWPATGSPSGPRWIFPVAPLDWTEPPLTQLSTLPASGFDGGVETAYSNTLLSWAHSISQKSLKPTAKYRDRILDLGPRYKSWADWVEHLTRRARGRAGLDMLSQAAPAVLLAESL